MTAKTQRKTGGGRSGGHESTDIEWIGGISTLPGYVADEDEPYHPEAQFWMLADGPILGSTAAGPGELPAIGQMGESFGLVLFPDIYAYAERKARKRNR
ncbi:MAG: hypothetical protein RQ826_02105 [Xanthomonadales bacterium]|nr:hypothetical protein [Xanthomonadales bacterium]